MILMFYLLCQNWHTHVYALFGKSLPSHLTYPYLHEAFNVLITNYCYTYPCVNQCSLILPALPLTLTKTCWSWTLPISLLKAYSFVSSIHFLAIKAGAPCVNCWISTMITINCWQCKVNHCESRFLPIGCSSRSSTSWTHK